MKQAYKKPSKSRKWRRARARDRNIAADIAGKVPCAFCGELAAHFVPPSLGEEGFYICAPEPAHETQNSEALTPDAAVNP